MSLHQAGLRQPAPLDQLNDLVGIVQVGGWGSEIGSSASEVGIPSWDATQGSVGGASTSQAYSLNELHGAQEGVGPSSHGRTTYTDAVLEMVFKDFLDNNEAYNDKVDELKSNVEEMSYSLARLVEENHHMQVWTLPSNKSYTYWYQGHYFTAVARFQEIAVKYCTTRTIAAFLCVSFVKIQ